MSVNGRSLELSITGSIAATGLRTDILTSDNAPKDILNYIKHVILFQNGAEVNEAEILYHNSRNFVAPGPEVINLDGGLTNVFGDVLDFHTIKFLVLRNNEVVTSDKFILVTVHGEQYYIGPQGFRMLIEPAVTGLEKSGASSGGDFGNLSISGVDNVNYDLIIAGSTGVVNISSGL